jgi:hypothetical protein
VGVGIRDELDGEGVGLAHIICELRGILRSSDYNPRPRPIMIRSSTRQGTHDASARGNDYAYAKF